MGQAQERYAGAEKAWRAAIQLKDTVEYWYDLYLLFYDHMTDKQKDEGLLLELYRKSYSAVSKASALEPKEPFYLAKSAEALQQIAQRETEAEALASYSHAEQALHEAVRLKPGESGYWYSLALTYDREGQIHEKKQEGALAQANYRDALNALEQSAKLSPDARTVDLRSKLLNKVAAGKQ
jgi:tetratricopeptide (TPR) repeat protein